MDGTLGMRGPRGVGRDGDEPVTRPARIGRRALLLAALVCTTCSACAGLPSWEAERDADLFNKSTGDVVTYVSLSRHGDGERHREDLTLPGDATSLTLGGGCMTGWWVQRATGAPIRLDKICPGDKVTVTDDAIDQ
jgi:hypothetical protein